jgi:hypothetical protein
MVSYMNRGTTVGLRCNLRVLLRHYADEESAQGFWYWEDEAQTWSSQPFLTKQEAEVAQLESRLVLVAMTLTPTQA